MITIKDRQRKIKIDHAQLQNQAQAALNALNYANFDLGIMLTTNRTIRVFNKKYRHKDKPTDVLSFPYHDKLKPGERIVVETEDDKNLGDLIISLEYVQKDRQKWGHTFEEHLLMLLVHGIVHLLGYDHEIDEEYLVMNKVEKKIVKSIKNKGLLVV